MLHAQDLLALVVELQRALAACQAPSLGFVLTGAERETESYYGAAYGYGHGAAPGDRGAAVTANGRPLSVAQEGRLAKAPAAEQAPNIEPS